MLIDFKVENYRSIREAQTFSLVAEAHKDHEATHILTGPDELRLIRTALIYGPNASGKSNLLDALDTLRWVIVAARRFDESDAIEPMQPFRLDAETRAKPSRFEVSFVQDGVRYEYELAATQTRVVAERLDYFPEGYRRSLFTREGDTIHLIGDLKRSATAKVSRTITQRRSNTPFLSILGQNEEPVAVEAYRWFKDTLRTAVSPMLSDTYTRKLLADDPKARTFILDLLRLADTGIRRVDTDKVAVEVPEEVRRFFSELDGKDAPSEHETIQLRLWHSDADDPDAAFDDGDESLGTRRFLALAGPLYDVLQNGRVLVIDEINDSLHPNLVRDLIGLFNNPEINRHSAQLVASTHDVTQLDLRRLRRDGVWFTEKERDGATTLFSLADFEGVRPDMALQKNYLQGRFGGLPVLGFSLLDLPSESDVETA